MNIANLCINNNNWEYPSLSVFPPQVTIGERVTARLESNRFGVESQKPGSNVGWSLDSDGSPIGSAKSYNESISFRIDQAGRKLITASSKIRGGVRVELGHADLVIHSTLEHEFAAILSRLDSFEAYRWVQAILDRDPTNRQHRDKVDLLLSGYLKSNDNLIRNTAFDLCCRLQEPTWRKVAVKFFKRDIHSIEDVLQDTKQRTLRSIERLELGERFGPWAHKTILNACLDAKKKKPLFSINETTLAIADCDHNIATKKVDDIDMFDYMTRNLNKYEVDLFKLRFGEELSYIEIANSCKIRPDSPEQTRITSVSRDVAKVVKILGNSQKPNSDSDGKGGLL